MNGQFPAVLVGCGSISQVWLSAIRCIPGLKIVGLVDVVVDKAKHRATEFGIDAPVYATLADALDAQRPTAVFDCTIASQRLIIATTAIGHQCHVLAEKPLAETVEDARRIADLASNSSNIYAVIQNHRYHVGSRRLERFLRADNIGEITFSSSTFAIGSRFDDFRQSMEHVLLQDMAIHTFDLARLFLDSKPISVYCREWNPRGSSFAHGAAAVAIFHFGNGAVYNYQGSWCSQGLRTNWQSAWRVNGTQGSVTWDGGETFQCELTHCEPDGAVTNKETPVPALDTIQKPEGHQGVISDFIDCIRSGQTPETQVSENIKSLQMVRAAIESSKKGRPVEIDSVQV